MKRISTVSKSDVSTRVVTLKDSRGMGAYVSIEKRDAGFGAVWTTHRFGACSRLSCPRAHYSPEYAKARYRYLIREALREGFQIVRVFDSVYPGHARDTAPPQCPEPESKQDLSDHYIGMEATKLRIPKSAAKNLVRAGRAEWDRSQPGCDSAGMCSIIYLKDLSVKP